MNAQTRVAEAYEYRRAVARARDSALDELHHAYQAFKAIDAQYREATEYMVELLTKQHKQADELDAVGVLE